MTKKTDRVPKPKIELAPQPGNVVCAIQVGNRWLVGMNSKKTSPKLRKKYSDGHLTFTHHAEARALQLVNRVGGKIKKVIVMRWNKHGKVDMARPCLHCMRLLMEANIKSKHVWYTNQFGRLVNLRWESGG